MSKFMIRRKVSLSFLGEEYNDAFIIFRAIPAIDYVDIENERKAVTEKDDLESIPYLVKILKRYFVSGEFISEGKTEEFTLEDIEVLDPDCVVTCFQKLTGAEVADPKAPEEAPSSTLSPTTASTSE